MDGIIIYLFNEKLTNATFNNASMKYILKYAGSWENKMLIFTSAKEVMFLPEFVCLCVRRITQKVMDGSF